MFFLLLTLLSSLSISMILKVNETRQGERLVVAGANYVVASILGVLLSEGSDLNIGWKWALVAAGIGVWFVAGFMLLMRSIRALGLAVPTCVARLSMLVPVGGSILMYGEDPVPIRMAGIAIGIGAFVLLGFSQRTPAPGRTLAGATIVLPGALFLVMGFNDFGMKIAQESGVDKGAFLFHVFGTAALFCWLAVAARRTGIRRHDILLGSLLGIPNYFSSYFLIAALKHLPSGIVFPALGAGGVVMVTAAGFLIWRELPNRAGLIGIALAALAVALLGL
jgi:multidrug transporter EmrE-like cation transporter